MKLKFQISNGGCRIPHRVLPATGLVSIRNPRFAGCGFPAFTLIEVMVVVTLLSFIVLALMAVFNSTQAAFRASITQTDVLEGGRAVMDLMVGDLKAMASASGGSNSVLEVNLGQVPVNFYAGTNGSAPLIQPLVGINDPNTMRTNVLEIFFILSHNNQTWTGTGYVVDVSSTNFIYPLYRFSPTDLPARPTPYQIFTNFLANSVLPVSPANTNMSHLIDGVVDLRVRAYDVNGYWMTNNFVFAGGQTTTNQNVFYLPATLGEVGFYMFSNTLPAAVEIQMATLEDRVLLRARSRPGDVPAPPADQRTLYLQNQSGKLHVFRQRVSIPNADPAAYQ